LEIPIYLIFCVFVFIFFNLLPKHRS
jgi:hypothetical protein